MRANVQNSQIGCLNRVCETRSEREKNSQRGGGGKGLKRWAGRERAGWGWCWARRGATSEGHTRTHTHTPLCRLALTEQMFFFLPLLQPRTESIATLDFFFPSALAPCVRDTSQSAPPRRLVTCLVPSSFGLSVVPGFAHGGAKCVACALAI